LDNRLPWVKVPRLASHLNQARHQHLDSHLSQAQLQHSDSHHSQGLHQRLASHRSQDKRLDFVKPQLLDKVPASVNQHSDRRALGSPLNRVAPLHSPSLRNKHRLLHLSVNQQRQEPRVPALSNRHSDRSGSVSHRRLVSHNHPADSAPVPFQHPLHSANQLKNQNHLHLVNNQRQRTQPLSRSLPRSLPRSLHNNQPPTPPGLSLVKYQPTRHSTTTIVF
jgi:hypothetical protein